MSDASGLIITTTITDVNGNYIFSDLCKDTYGVSEVQQVGWTQISPANPNDYQITITSANQLITNKNFVTKSIIQKRNS